MYIVTTLSYDDLGDLIRNKQISLNNAKLLFGFNADTINEYFSERIGHKGYVVGLQARLNRTTADLFSRMDKSVKSGGRVILEAEIDEGDMIKYSVDGISAAAEALAYGLPKEDIYEQLDDARADDKSAGVEVICVPYIRANGKVTVTSLTEDLEFKAEGITFVKLGSGG